MLTLVVAGLAAGGACAIFGVSIVVLHRMAGVVNFSQAVVGAFGAYVAAVGVERGWDLLVALAAGVVLSSALSTAIGLLFARLFSETGAAVRTAAMIATTVGLFAAGFRCFGDTPRGVPVLLPGVSASIGGVVVAAGLIEGNRVHPPGFADSNEGFFLFCAVTLGAVGAGVTVLRRARAGRWWSCVRHSERATAAMGRSVVVTKLSAFAVSAAVAGLGGALLLALNGIVSGASFQPIESMTILTSALIFGAGHFEGAVLTGLFGQLIPNFLSDVGLPRDIAPMIFAVGGVIALSRGEGGLSAALRGVAGKVRRAARSSEPDVGTGAAAEDIRPGRRPTSSTVLDIRGVSVSYGAVKALQDVSLSVPEGGFVGLIGPNGAGKSTLVDTLSGFIVRHEGHVLLDGEDVTALSPRRRAHRGMRRTFQQGHTPRDLTVGGYLELAATRAGAPAGEALGWFRLPPAPTPIPMTESPRTQLARPAGPGLRVEALRVHRMGQPVVRGVDLSVAPGEVTVLLGANGAGKSTLLDGISGVVPAAAGRVILDGEDITRSTRRHRVRAGLAYVQQGRTVFPSLTVEENFLVAAGRSELDPAFDLFPELLPRASVAAKLLSGGEQQMVVLGRAILRRPRILMIDELSLGLAPAVVDRMLEAVQRLAASGVGLLLVEQFADRALAVDDRAVVVTRGEVVLEGSASKIRRRPDRLRKAYLGETVESSPVSPASVSDGP